MAWFTNWNYRKAITISNAGSTISDYQVLTTIDTASLITAGKMRSDCGDIRFTDDDGSTLLPYWIESGPNTASTKIWAKIPSVTAGAKTIYIYYGNSAGTYNNSIGGMNTFLFFDDFNDGDYTNNPTWSVVAGTWSASAGYLAAGSGVPEITVPQTTAYGIYEWKFMRDGTYADHSHTNFIRNASGNGYNFFYNNSAAWDTIGFYFNNILWAQSLTVNQWYNIKITRSPSGVFDFYIDGVWKATRTDNTYTTSALLRLQEGGSNSNWDDIRIRKYASPEPTTILEQEQTPPNITATLMTITPSESPCRVGICTVTVNVTWTNYGGTSGDFIPNITIDGTPYSGPYPLQSLEVGLSEIKTFTVSGLAVGTRSICPYPN